MRIRTLVYYITTGFALGIILLVAVQYTTSSHLRQLISGNESVLDEYKVTNNLVVLQNDLLLLDNRIKTAIITGDSTKIRDFESAVKKIKNDIKVIGQSGSSNAAAGDILKLRSLVRQKIDFSHQFVDTFHQTGKPASDHLTTNKINHLSEQITALTHKIDTSGRAKLAEKIKSVDQSGQDVLQWNFFISLLVLVLLSAVFFIVINRMRKQAELIDLLNTSEKKLRQAALVKENFLANMSHEIRTPLNAILGYTQLLQREKLGKTALLHLSTVRQSGETLLSIVNDILDLSKIESGMMRIEKFPFSISELVHSITTMFHHRVRDKGLEFSISLSPSIPDTLMGDATRLTQILVNLMGNAVKFTEYGKIALSVQEKEMSLAEVEIEFRVSDTGIGIAKDKLESIFERFSQAEDSTTRKFGGTGLGLSIVRDLIYLQNGTIHLQSKPEEGTEVIFVMAYGIVTPTNQQNHFEVKKPAVTFNKNLKVLIVEDNVINQGLMAQVMKDWGIVNSIASNGKEAIQILSETSFDLVFMDIQMPEMDGYTAATQIRQNLKLEIPIVAMTAHAMTGEREKCISAGMNEHIAKPIRINELKELLSRLLKTTHSDQFPVDNRSESQFKVIDLSYMKEIGGGDSQYERLVTEQFLTLVPSQIVALREALANRNYVEMKRIAHSLKTSVSIMGVDVLLQDELDLLEDKDAETMQLEEKILRVMAVCNAALKEAKMFYDT